MQQQSSWKAVEWRSHKPKENPMKSLIVSSITVCTLLGAVVGTKADTTVGLDPAKTWNGFMNVFEIPANGGGYVFGSTWGTADLRATFSGTTLTLGVNDIGDPNAFWYTPSGGPGAVGNKTMDASMYVEVNDGSLSGQTVTFNAQVTANTLTTNASYTSVAFIKDFAPDFSSSVSTTVALTPGPFSISLATIADPARHVQYGFETIGPDVWVTDIGNYGTVTIVPAVSAPTSPTITASAIGSALKLSFPTQTGFTYTVQYVTNLTSTNWVTLTNVAGTGTTQTANDAASQTKRFYRTYVH